MREGIASSQTKKAAQKRGSDRLSATLRFDGPVEAVSQVSPQRARALSVRGIEVVRDLLDRFPRRYLDMSQVVTIAQATIGLSCTLVARIYETKVKKPRRNLNILEITLLDSTGTLIVTCFNQPWLADKLHKDDLVSVSGTIEFNYGFKRMTNPIITRLEDAGEAHGIIQAFHGSINKLSPSIVKRMIAHALEEVRGLYDPLPLFLRERYRLCSRYQAYRAIHFPESIEEVDMARRRLLYEELFFLELQLITEQREHALQFPGFEQGADEALVSELAHVLPFELTSEQAGARDEIWADMAAPKAMDRLLLGDVGTGKTIVAFCALVCAARNAHQAVMVGPTEILVKQYARSLGPLLDRLGVSWCLLTSTTPTDEKERSLQALAEGQVSICFGTHAVFEPSVALALYGTTAISYLRKPPQIKSSRTTTVLPFTEEGVAYDAVRAALARGEQAYVVCPLIGIPTKDLLASDEEESEDEQIEYALVEFGLESDAFNTETAGNGQASRFTAAEQHAEILQGQVFPSARVALLHGRLAAEEKSAIMEAFRAGEIDVLVSTTIIEVGIDVPNATVMIIEDADRFGLAQLHQLRGRVGRGEKPGAVYLVTRSKAPAALERLRAMEVTEDGFELSEIDLAQRKEGDVFGARQHGQAALRLVNVVRDRAVIEAAYQDAYDIIYNDTLSEAERVILERERSMVACRLNKERN